jgi:2-(1,2-epoxy-1,2-dihydrophenyl)acetyl-CoA isomerase
MDPTVEVERREGWRLVRLNRPERLNAMNAPMHAALLAALDAAAADASCRAVLLTGAGRGFCAGQELGPEVTPGPAGAPDLGPAVDRFADIVRRIRALPVPVVAAVNGVAAGAGANVALACDLVLAARSARFIQAFIKIGLIPDAGGTWFLPRLIGEARARALAMTGAAIDAEQAAGWGMIWQAVADEELMAKAEALTAELARQPTGALGLMKRAFEAGAGNTLEAQLDLERDLQRAAGRSADYAEGVAAFLEKRPPRFSGGRA